MSDRHASQSAEACDACQNVDCPDKHLCDVPTGAALAAAVAECEAQLLDEGFVAEAKTEIGRSFLGGGQVVEPELVADFVLALRDGKGQYAGHAAAARLLREGLTLTEVAIQVGLPVAAVVNKFTQIPQDRLADVLRAETLLRAGSVSYGSVAKQVSLSRQQVLWLARNLGIESLASANRKAGGGTKYTAEMIARGWKLRDEGRSYREIAEAMELKDTNAAVGMLRRNARPSSDSACGVETVAS